MKKLIIFVILGLLLWMIAEARGHGLADWIMADPRTYYCCGPEECEVAAPGEIIRVDGGWLHKPTGTVLPEGSPHIHPSVDSQTWRCVRFERLICLFLPVGA